MNFNELKMQSLVHKGAPVYLSELPPGTALITAVSNEIDKYLPHMDAVAVNFHERYYFDMTRSQFNKLKAQVLSGHSAGIPLWLVNVVHRNLEIIDDPAVPDKLCRVADNPTLAHVIEVADLFELASKLGQQLVIKQGANNMRHVTIYDDYME